ncbi:MAG: hypothetical protein Q9220_000030 [cf. Caloplaca sp. 1 TL-2023]
MIPIYLVSFLVADALFVATGGLLVAVALLSRSSMSAPTTDTVARSVLLSHAPLNGVLVDAGLVFVTFLASVPGLIITKRRFWFQIHLWLVLASIVLTLTIGLTIWFSTLKTRANLALMWHDESPQIQHLLQQRVRRDLLPNLEIRSDPSEQFQCCGYMTMPFLTDTTCPTPLAAAAKPDCVGPFSNFANNFLDLVFTAMFGMVALDAILLLCGLVVQKKRAEEQRYQHIDEKEAMDSHAKESAEVDPKVEQLLVRKLDFHIVPLFVLIYLFSFLDRRGSGITQNYAGLVACRLLLGLVEGGLFPGAAIYMTLFYTKHELALRISYLFVSAAIAGAVGGLLAYGIGFMDGVAGQRGWRWILILEGLPSFILGIATWFLLADNPETAYYLSIEEKDLVRLRRQRQAELTESAREFHKADVYAGLKDWRVYAFAAGQFGTDTMLYGYSTFLPTIIKGLGKWSTAQTQALTIPCYCLGAVSYLIVARVSDWQQRRGLYAVIFAFVSVVGYGILASDASKGVHYFGCFVVACGLYIACGLPLAWLPSNMPRYGKRTTATGIQLTAPVPLPSTDTLSAQLYPSSESPRFIRGHAVSLGMVGMAGVIFASLTWYYSRRNDQRRAGEEDSRIENMSEEEIAELGDESPRFIFTT